ncbi:MAG: hypothetical protein IT507_07240 [Burkholderiaceae bacterium]|nr:hypothetical protein [Burkholderiaceae bacterium]
MADFLLVSALFVLAMVALGLFPILRGASEADSLMAAQLLGTGGIAALLLLGAATGVAAVVDVALTLALLAAFASFAFVKARESKAANTSPRDRAAEFVDRSGDSRDRSGNSRDRSSDSRERSGDSR